jgi:hypothetical protein
MDEDGGDAQEIEVTRDGQSGVAVHLYWSRLQPLSIAKPNGPSMTSDGDTGPANRIARDLNRFRVESMNVKSRFRRTRNLNFQQAAKRVRERF